MPGTAASMHVTRVARYIQHGHVGHAFTAEEAFPFWLFDNDIRRGLQAVRDDYGRHEAWIRGMVEEIPASKKPAYNDGFGSIEFIFQGGLTQVTFKGWSSDPIPDPVITREEAVLRAVEFARTDPTLSGPECGLPVPDRSAEDTPRYVYLDQVLGTPFWRLDMGSCEARHSLAHAAHKAPGSVFSWPEIDVIRAHLRQQDPDMDWHEAAVEVLPLRLDAEGNIDASGLDRAKTVYYLQDELDRAHRVDVDVFVDALDGGTVWFEENREDDRVKKDRNAGFGDDNVWFLEGGRVTFASGWPRGYLGETSLFMEELIRR